jgi:hypothetical protein
MTPMNHRFAWQMAVSLTLSLTLLCACGKPKPEADDAKAAPDEKRTAADKNDAGGQGVSLTAEEVAKLGIATTAAAAVRYVPSRQGFAVVQGHDAIAQAVADVATARAEERQSQAALARIARLAGTAGAASTEAHESAARQAAVDAAALRLAEAKASVILGLKPPWSGHDDDPVLADLAAGRSKLLRVTFPLGALNGPAPAGLGVARLDASPASERWTAHPVWDAPADMNMPGRSFFALLRRTDAGEGERLLVLAAGEGSESADAGVLVPASAVVLSEGKYWCFVVQRAGLFTRVPLDISRPMADGYFTKDAIRPGEAIVTSAAGLLLARQTNPGSEAD